jgi:hypothetical protein
LVKNEIPKGTDEKSDGNLSTFMITKGIRPSELKPESKTSFTAISLKGNPTVPTTSMN